MKQKKNSNLLRSVTNPSKKRKPTTRKDTLKSTIEEKVQKKNYDTLANDLSKTHKYFDDDIEIMVNPQSNYIRTKNI